MQATILSYRRGRHTQTTNQLLLELEGIDSKEKAAKWIGKRVVWKSPVQTREKKPKLIAGTITATHGNSGIVRARFTRGLPGTAVTTTLKIED